MLGLRTDNLYWFGPEYAEQRYSKFKFCKDQNCAAGQIIEPSDKILLWDTYGYPKTGLLGGGWLNNAQNGNHIGRTTDVSLAGKFSIGKWSCGKYCLGGFEWGLGPACPTDYPAITFFPNDPQVCFPVEITEVPCDIKQVSNDCNWDDGCDCCKKTGHTEL
ncbi:cysteine-rich secreted protein [Aspergillus lucknowensis]|uniref:Uncharacterized protein n=1 Tax=Aspergillus lucknowensis TaxID=176173 RepID=A0ABR4LLA4_9EURO